MPQQLGLKHKRSRDLCYLSIVSEGHVLSESQYCGSRQRLPDVHPRRVHLHKDWLQGMQCEFKLGLVH